MAMMIIMIVINHYHYQYYSYSYGNYNHYHNYNHYWFCNITTGILEDCLFLWGHSTENWSVRLFITIEMLTPNVLDTADTYRQH